MLSALQKVVPLDERSLQLAALRLQISNVRFDLKQLFRTKLSNVMTGSTALVTNGENLS